LEGSKPQILKLGPATKMGPTSQFIQFLQWESTKIDEKLYNDPFWIMHNANSHYFLYKFLYLSIWNSWLIMTRLNNAVI